VRSVRLAYQVLYVAATVGFALCGLGLLVVGGAHLLEGVWPGDGGAVTARFQSFLEAVGVITIAVASFELSQTVLEEEVLRDAQMSAPTRVRRFLSRFMVVVVVSASVEFLIAIFELFHGKTEQMIQAASIGVATAALLIGWGAFIRWNRSAEELEPDSLSKAKAEDRKVEK
jgi:hypothetical protein